MVKLVSDDVWLDIRLTQADLAALIGTTRETIAVQLAQPAAEGLVRIEGRSIIVLNATAGV